MASEDSDSTGELLLHNDGSESSGESASSSSSSSSSASSADENEYSDSFDDEDESDGEKEKNAKKSPTKKTVVAASKPTPTPAVAAAAAPNALASSPDKEKESPPPPPPPAPAPAPVPNTPPKSVPKPSSASKKPDAVAAPTQDKPAGSALVIQAYCRCKVSSGVAEEKLSLHRAASQRKKALEKMLKQELLAEIESGVYDNEPDDSPLAKYSPSHSSRSPKGPQAPGSTGKASTLSTTSSPTPSPKAAAVAPTPAAAPAPATPSTAATEPLDSSPLAPDQKEEVRETTTTENAKLLTPARASPKMDEERREHTDHEAKDSQPASTPAGSAEPSPSAAQSPMDASDTSDAEHPDDRSERRGSVTTTQLAGPDHPPTSSQPTTNSPATPAAVNSRPESSTSSQQRKRQPLLHVDAGYLSPSSSGTKPSPKTGGSTTKPSLSPKHILEIISAPPSPPLAPTAAHIKPKTMAEQIQEWITTLEGFLTWDDAEESSWNTQPILLAMQSLHQSVVNNVEASKVVVDCGGRDLMQRLVEKNAAPVKVKGEAASVISHILLDLGWPDVAPLIKTLFTSLGKLPPTEMTVFTQYLDALIAIGSIPPMATHLAPYLSTVLQFLAQFLNQPTQSLFPGLRSDGTPPLLKLSVQDKTSGSDLWNNVWGLADLALLIVRLPATLQPQSPEEIAEKAATFASICAEALHHPTVELQTQMHLFHCCWAALAHLETAHPGSLFANPIGYAYLHDAMVQHHAVVEHFLTLRCACNPTQFGRLMAQLVEHCYQQQVIQAAPRASLAAADADAEGDHTSEKGSADAVVAATADPSDINLTEREPPQEAVALEAADDELLQQDQLWSARQSFAGRLFQSQSDSEQMKWALLVCELAHADQIQERLHGEDASKVLLPNCLPEEAQQPASLFGACCLRLLASMAASPSRPGSFALTDSTLCDKILMALQAVPPPASAADPLVLLAYHLQLLHSLHGFVQKYENRRLFELKDGVRIIFQYLSGSFQIVLGCIGMTADAHVSVNTWVALAIGLIGTLVGCRLTFSAVAKNRGMELFVEILTQSLPCLSPHTFSLCVETLNTCLPYMLEVRRYSDNAQFGNIVRVVEQSIVEFADRSRHLWIVPTRWHALKREHPHFSELSLLSCTQILARLHPIVAVVASVIDPNAPLESSRATPVAQGGGPDNRTSPRTGRNLANQPKPEALALRIRTLLLALHLRCIQSMHRQRLHHRAHHGVQAREAQLVAEILQTPETDDRTIHERTVDPLTLYHLCRVRGVPLPNETPLASTLPPHINGGGAGVTPVTRGTDVGMEIPKSASSIEPKGSETSNFESMFPPPPPGTTLNPMAQDFEDHLSFFARKLARAEFELTVAQKTACPALGPQWRGMGTLREAMTVMAKSQYPVQGVGAQPSPQGNLDGAFQPLRLLIHSTLAGRQSANDSDPLKAEVPISEKSEPPTEKNDEEAEDPQMETWMVDMFKTVQTLKKSSETLNRCVTNRQALPSAMSIPLDVPSSPKNRPIKPPSANSSSGRTPQPHIIVVAEPVPPPTTPLPPSVEPATQPSAPFVDEIPKQPSLTERSPSTGADVALAKTSSVASSKGLSGDNDEQKPETDGSVPPQEGSDGLAPSQEGKEKAERANSISSQQRSARSGSIKLAAEPTPQPPTADEKEPVSVDGQVAESQKEHESVSRIESNLSKGIESGIETTEIVTATSVIEKKNSSRKSSKAEMVTALLSDAPEGDTPSLSTELPSAPGDGEPQSPASSDNEVIGDAELSGIKKVPSTTEVLVTTASTEGQPPPTSATDGTSVSALATSTMDASVTDMAPQPVPVTAAVVIQKQPQPTPLLVQVPSTRPSISSVNPSARKLTLKELVSEWRKALHSLHASALKVEIEARDLPTESPIHDKLFAVFEELHETSLLLYRIQPPYEPIESTGIQDAIDEETNKTQGRMDSALSCATCETKPLSLFSHGDPNDVGRSMSVLYGRFTTLSDLSKGLSAVLAPPPGAPSKPALTKPASEADQPAKSSSRPSSAAEPQTKPPLEWLQDCAAASGQDIPALQALIDLLPGADGGPRKVATPEAVSTEPALPDDPVVQLPSLVPILQTSQKIETLQSLRLRYRNGLIAPLLREDLARARFTHPHLADDDPCAIMLGESIVNHSALLPQARLPKAALLNALVNNDAISALAFALHVFGYNANIAVLCLQALTNVVALQAPFYLLQPLIRVGIFGLLFQAMQRLPYRPYVPALCLRLLYALVKPETFQVFTAYNGIEALVEFAALKDPEQPVTLQKLALNLLAAYDFDAEAQVRFARCGGVPATTAIFGFGATLDQKAYMTMFLPISGNLDCQPAFLGCPHLVGSYNEEDREQFKDQTLTFLHDEIRRSTAVATVRTRCLRVLANLCGSAVPHIREYVHRTLVGQGIVQRMVHIIFRNRFSVDIVGAACTLLRHLSANEDYRKHIVDSGGVQALMESLSGVPYAVGVLNQSLTALLNLLQDDYVPAFMPFVRPKNARTLRNTMQRHPFEDSVLGKCCQLLDRILSFGAGGPITSDIIMKAQPPPKRRQSQSPTKRHRKRYDEIEYVVRTDPESQDEGKKKGSKKKRKAGADSKKSPSKSQKDSAKVDESVVETSEAEDSDNAPSVRGAETEGEDTTTLSASTVDVSQITTGPDISAIPPAADVNEPSLPQTEMSAQNQTTQSTEQSTQEDATRKAAEGGSVEAMIVTIRQNLLTENLAVPLVAAMARLIGVKSVQSHCLSAVSRLAMAGPAAQESLTSAAAHVLVPVQITESIEAHPSDPHLLHSSVLALLALCVGNPEVQKDVSCTPRCLKVLCRAIMGMFHEKRAGTPQASPQNQPADGGPVNLFPDSAGAKVQDSPTKDADQPRVEEGNAKPATHPASSDSASGSSQAKSKKIRRKAKRRPNSSDSDSQNGSESSASESNSGSSDSDRKHKQNSRNKTQKKKQAKHRKGSSDSESRSDSYSSRSRSASGSESRSSSASSSRSQSSSGDSDYEKRRSSKKKPKAKPAQPPSSTSPVAKSAPPQPPPKEDPPAKGDKNTVAKKPASKGAPAPTKKSSNTKQQKQSKPDRSADSPAAWSATQSPKAKDRSVPQSPTTSPPDQPPPVSSPSDRTHTSHHHAPPSDDVCEAMMPIARDACRLFAVFSTTRSIERLVATYCVECALFLIECYATQPDPQVVVANALRLLVSVGGQEECRRYVFCRSTARLILELLDTHHYNLKVVNCCAAILSHLTRKPATADRLFGAGSGAEDAVRCLIRVLNTHPNRVRLCGHCCRALAQLTYRNTENRKRAVEYKIVEPSIRLLTLVKDKETTSAWASVLIGNLCSNPTLRSMYLKSTDLVAVLLANALASLPKSQILKYKCVTKEVEELLAWREQMRPQYSDHPPFVVQALGYAFACLVPPELLKKRKSRKDKKHKKFDDDEQEDEEDGEDESKSGSESSGSSDFDSDEPQSSRSSEKDEDGKPKLDPRLVDNEDVVKCIQSHVVCSILAADQHTICETALLILQRKAKGPTDAFVRVPQFDRDKKPIAPIKQIFADRLRRLKKKVRKIRHADALRASQVQESRMMPGSPKHSERRAPPPEREHVSTPRVYWAFASPPIYTKPQRMPGNPEKIRLEGVSHISARICWDRPSGDYPLVYTVRLSSDRGRTFTRVTPEPIQRRNFVLTDLQPDTLYFVTVTSAIDEESMLMSRTENEDQTDEDEGEDKQRDTKNKKKKPAKANTSLGGSSEASGVVVPAFSARKMARRPRKLVHFHTMPTMRPPDRFCMTPTPAQRRMTNEDVELLSRSLPPLIRVPRK